MIKNILSSDFSRNLNSKKLNNFKPKKKKNTFWQKFKNIIESILCIDNGYVIFNYSRLGKKFLKSELIA